MLNKAQLIGRLGQDPDLRHTGSGKAVCRLSVATSEGKGDKKITEWHSVVVWEKQAELCNQYLSKGRLVYVEGRIQKREYERDGEKRVAYEIIAWKVQFLDSGKSNGSKSKGGDDKGGDWGDDDIPF